MTKDIRSWLKLCETGDSLGADDNLLLELDWFDKSPMSRVLRANKSRWIHFSNGAPNRKLGFDDPKQVEYPEKIGPQFGYYNQRDYAKKKKEYDRGVRRAERMNALQNVAKIGVNPGPKYHRDICGTYFYPVDWLLAGSERVRNGQQYGLSMKYYYICDLVLDGRGINLKTVSWVQIAAIAQRNGWLDQLEAFKSLSPEDQKKGLPIYSNPDHPGFFLWHFCEQLNQDGIMSWNKALRGLTYIRDENGSIIHSNEPDQIVVFDPSIIKIIDSGETKGDKYGSHQTDKPDHWDHAFQNIIKGVRGEFGGDLTWMKKIPTLKFSNGRASFVLTIPERSWHGGCNLSLTYKHGRSEGDFSVGRESMENRTTEQVVAYISDFVRRIGARKSDLLFKPVMSEIEGKKLLTDKVVGGRELTFNTVIHNPTNPEDARYADIRITGKGSHEYERQIVVSQNIGLALRVRKYSGTIAILMNDHGCASAHTMDDYEVGQENEFLDELAQRLGESIKLFFHRVGPTGYGDSWKRFSDPVEHTAFQGWFIIVCGIDLDGRLHKMFEGEIAAYVGYDHKEDLLWRISNRVANF